MHIFSHRLLALTETTVTKMQARRCGGNKTKNGKLQVYLLYNVSEPGAVLSPNGANKGADPPLEAVVVLLLLLEVVVEEILDLITLPLTGIYMFIWLATSENRLFFRWLSLPCRRNDVKRTRQH